MNLSNYMDENWHGGQIDGDFFDHPEMQIEENLTVQKKPKKLIWDWKHAVTRELMRGKHKNEILDKYKTVIDRLGIYNIVKGFLDNNQGVIGYFIIDVSNFDDNFTYDNIPDELKLCNLYAINATTLREVINRSLVSENDGTMDGYLNSDDSIDEEVYYYDDYTGLPCIDGWNGNQSDDDDERLDKIADIFLGRKWMTLAQKQKFLTMEGKLPYLVSIVRRAFRPKSNSNSKFDDDINDYQVKNEDLKADSMKSVKNVDIKNVQEKKLDDIGDTSIPKKVEIKKENKKSDFKKDINLNKKVKQTEVKNINEGKLDDIGNIPSPKRVDIKSQVNPSDLKQDVKFNKKFKNTQIDNLKESVIDDIGNTSMPKKVEIKKEVNPDDYKQDVDYISKNTYDINDSMRELKSKDYNIDVKFDNLSEFVIDDIKDMKDDEFDFSNTSELVIDDIKDMKDEDFDLSDVSDGDVDLNEMFDSESDKNQINIDKKNQEIEISNKYDWSW